MRKTITIICLLTSGCSTIPDTVAECETSQEWIERVEECRDLVVEKEDRKAKKRAQEQLEDALARRCWEATRGAWDRRSKSCKSFDML